MGIKAKLSHEAAVISHRVGGSIRNQSQRYRLLAPFLDYLQEQRALPKRLKDIDLAVLSPFVRWYLKEDVGIGHLHNTLAAIRVILRHAGVDVTDVSNSRLEVPARSRIGKKRPYTPAELKALWPRTKRKDIGFYHVVRLQRLLGLRSQEALMCGPSLGDWLTHLRDCDLGNATLLPVTRGAKNNRHREVEILRTRATETLDAIAEAHAYCVSNEFRLIGVSNNLKKAKFRLIYLYRSTGIIEERSSHALRYTYACDKASELLADGLAPNDVLRRLSNYLGHGDSRFRWIKSVYCRTIAPSLESPADKRAAQTPRGSKGSAPKPETTPKSKADAH